MTNELKIGEVVRLLGLLNEDITDVIESAKKARLRSGYALVVSGKVSQRNLELALYLQELMRYRGMSVEAAKQIVHLVTNGQLSLEAAYAMTDTVARDFRVTILGRILVEAGVTSEAQVQEAHDLHKNTGIQMGYALVLTGAISRQNLDSVVALQTDFRWGLISFDQLLIGIRKTVHIDGTAAPTTLVAVA